MLLALNPQVCPRLKCRGLARDVCRFVPVRRRDHKLDADGMSLNCQFFVELVLESHSDIALELVERGFLLDHLTFCGSATG